MQSNKSTYQMFEAFQNQLFATIFVVVIGAYLITVVRTCFVSPETVATGLLQSEKQAFQDGLNKALNQ